jgi:putative hydrolase of the HAD superfamily
VKPALERLRERGERLAVVSNWDASLPDVLARLGLAPLFDVIVTSAQAGARKPDPAIFSAVGVPVWLHVGDSIEEDVAGARAAGIEPVLLRRDGAGGPAGVRTVASLSDL